MPDPEMAGLVKLFLRDLPSRLDALEASWQRGEHDEVRSQAHLLAGAAMMYQLAPICRVARALEMTLSMEQAVDADGAAFRRFDELIEVGRGMLAAA